MSEPTFYKMISKIWKIYGVNPLWEELLDEEPKYAVKIYLENSRSTVLITDGEYCYFESNPSKFYGLMAPYYMDKEYWKLCHKKLGTMKLHV